MLKFRNLLNRLIYKIIRKYHNNSNNNKNNSNISNNNNKWNFNSNKSRISKYKIIIKIFTFYKIKSHRHLWWILWILFKCNSFNLWCNNNFKLCKIKWLNNNNNNHNHNKNLINLINNQKNHNQIILLNHNNKK